MREENLAIIKALNMYGRVPEQWELLNEIERLKDLCNKYEEEHKTTFEEWKKSINIINELEKELDRGYLDLFEHELVPGRELITNIKNYLQELKGSGKE